MKVLRKEFAVCGANISVGFISDWKDADLPDGEFSEISKSLEADIPLRHKKTEVRLTRMSYGEFAGHTKVLMHLIPTCCHNLRIVLGLLATAGFERVNQEY